MEHQVKQGCINRVLISPRILKESWWAIMIVRGVRSFVCCLFVCPPMISLNDWRYEILAITKKFCLYVMMCNRKKIQKKSFFLACGVIFSRKLTFCLSPRDFSERLKIWKFDKNKKVSSRWVEVQQKRKFWKKSFFWRAAIFLAKNWHLDCPPMISLNG